jgi:hypothetical protein
MWEFIGRKRPPFAEALGPGQESVWDYPRPPKLVADQRHVVVRGHDYRRLASNVGRDSV